MKKTDKIFARYAMEDIVIEKPNPDEEPDVPYEAYFIGYEDESGEECDEEGVYLNQEDDN